MGTTSAPVTAALLAGLFIGAGARAADGPTLTDPALADPALAAAVGGQVRSPRLVARDAARHPLGVLAFFGITPGSTVVELWPTGGYWTEILAPYLRDRGTLYAALEDQPSGSPTRDAALKRDSYFVHRLADDPATFDRVKVTAFGPGQDAMAPPGSADLIISFRNLHAWMKQGFAEEALVDCYMALKPGGILAMEDHRGKETTEQDINAASGYVRQDYATGLAELAGFEPVDSSEIEANPKDTADWPRGVWTLGPTFALGEQDRDRYTAVGEPDDFLLRFRKPR